MKHCEDYNIVLSDEGTPVFILPFATKRIKNPIMLYDGGNHATLFRSDEDVVLVDYIPPAIQKILADCSWVVVLEKNKDGADIATDYKAVVKHVKTNPLTDGLK